MVITIAIMKQLCRADALCRAQSDYSTLVTRI